MSNQNGDDDPPVIKSVAAAPKTLSQKLASVYEAVWLLVAVGTLVGGFAGWWPWQIIYLVIIFGVGSGFLGALLGLWSLDDLTFGNDVGGGNTLAW